MPTYTPEKLQFAPSCSVMRDRHIQKVSFISGPTEHQDSGTPSTFATQQQLRPPLGVQTGRKRDALNLRVCLQCPQLLIHSLFTSTTDTQAKISISSHRFSGAGHYVNRLFISLSTYMLLTRIMALLNHFYTVCFFYRSPVRSSFVADSLHPPAYCATVALRKEMTKDTLYAVKANKTCFL